MSGPKKSKTRPLRPPFLVTVAALAGALVPGCGGAETSDATGPDGAANCPATEPANGSSCATAGQVCEYPFCASLSTQVKCVDGKWTQQTFGSCNTPPPVSQCPLGEPEAGTDCFAHTPPACSYPRICCGVDVGINYYGCSVTGKGWRTDSNGNDPGECGPCSVDASSRVPTPPDGGSG